MLELLKKLHSFWNLCIRNIVSTISSEHFPTDFRYFEFCCFYFQNCRNDIAISSCDAPQCCPPFINVDGVCQSDQENQHDELWLSI